MREFDVVLPRVPVSERISLHVSLQRLGIVPFGPEVRDKLGVLSAHESHVP